MTDQRSAFRFRVPRLRPSVPPPRPATSGTRTTARRPPIQPRTPPLPVRPQATAPGPPPVQPQGPTPAPALPFVQSPPPPQPIRPEGTTTGPPPQEPDAPTVPIHPLGSVPASPPEPLLVEPSTHDEPPTLPAHLLGTVPASPPEPSTAPAPQDEPPPKLAQAAPSSPSQTTIQSRFSSQPPSPSHISTEPHVSAKSPPPTTRSPPSSQPSSPPPEVKNSKGTASNNGQKGGHLVLNSTPTKETNEKIHEDPFQEPSSEFSNSDPHIRKQQNIKTQKTDEKQHESEDAISTTSNITNTPQTKSMISHPEDKIPVPKSAKNPNPNGPRAPNSEETTDTNLTDHQLDEKSATVITLSGENRGSSMRIGSESTKREWKIHIHRRYKVNPDEITDTTTDGEESSNETKMENDIKPNENKDKNSYINCNVQGINNSVVYSCFVSERNPGVNLGSSSKPGNKSKRNKVKVNVTPTQSQKYTIRRRCLRGLFMESSDSDPDNPQKARRHGCRYKSNKDDKMDVV